MMGLAILHALASRGDADSQVVKWEGEEPPYCWKTTEKGGACWQPGTGRAGLCEDHEQVVFG